MKNYEYLPHIADVRIRLEADSLEELFSAGMLSIQELLKPGICEHEKQANVIKAIEIQSLDTTSLLIDFLSDLLTLSHTEQAIFCNLEIKALTSTKILAEVKGMNIESFDEDIKAVTYHEAEVVKNRTGRWETLVVVDI